VGIVFGDLQEINLIYVENRSFCPHPKSLSLLGEGLLSGSPSPKREKGLGDEGFFFSYGKNYSFQDGRGLVGYFLVWKSLVAVTFSSLVQDVRKKLLT
jgi:hypothetical protein